MANVLVFACDRARGERYDALLRGEGHGVLGIVCDINNVEVARHYVPDVGLVHLDFPPGDALELCRQLRADPILSGMGLVMVSPSPNETEELLAFLAGTDDYVARSDSGRVISARIKAVLRRRRQRVVATEGLSIDCGNFAVRVDGKPISMTCYEFHVLGALAKSRGRVVSRADLVASVWGTSDAASHRLVDIYVQRLRRKLRHYGPLIETIRGVGYCLSESD